MERIWKKGDLETQLSQMISPYGATRDFIVRAEVNGITLDLLEISDRLRDLAQIRYQLAFVGDMFTVSGRARLNYLRPEATDPSVKARFRELVEKDKGRALYQYLESKKRAADFRLQTNSEMVGLFPLVNRYHSTA